MLLQPIKTHFNEETHKYYTENNEEIASVSRIINTAEHFKHIPAAKQKEIMSRGSILHQNVDYFITTGDTMGDVVLESFAEKYEELKKMFGNYLISEKALAASYNNMMFGGKPDLVLENAVVEIKSSLGSSERLYAMQLAAYALLCKAHNICNPEKLVIIYRASGGWMYKIIADKYGGITPTDAFLYALQKYYYAKKISELEQKLHNYNNLIGG